MIRKPLDPQHEAQDLIRLIYDAALNPERWPLFIERLGSLAPDLKVSLSIGDEKRVPVGPPVLVNWEKSWAKSYTDHYANTNVWAKTMMSMNIGDLMDYEEALKIDDLIKTPFYNEWLRPQNIIGGITIYMHEMHSYRANVTILCAPSSIDQLRLRIPILRDISQHLVRAANISEKILAVNGTLQSMERTFSFIDRGVVLLQSDGRPSYWNECAARYLDLRDGLLFRRDGRIGCDDKETEDRLSRLVAAAGQTVQGTGTVPSADGVIAIPRQNASLPWRVTVFPIPAGSMALGGSQASVGLFIYDPNRRPVISVASLRTVLGFTTAEARTCIALAEGKSPDEIAAYHGNTVMTVRTHLRNAMSKVGVNRLAELVALVTRCGY